MPYPKKYLSTGKTKRIRIPEEYYEHIQFILEKYDEIHTISIEKLDDMQNMIEKVLKKVTNKP